MTTQRTLAFLSAFGLSLTLGCAHTLTPTAIAAPLATEAPAIDPLWQEYRVEESIRPIYFGSNSARLTAAGRAALDEDIAVLKRWPEARVLLKGHTDSEGDFTYNLNLGAHRAAAVRAYMVAKGVDLSRILITSEGENEASEASDEILVAFDRRVDLIVLWNDAQSVSMSDRGVRR